MSWIKKNILKGLWFEQVLTRCFLIFDTDSGVFDRQSTTWLQTSFIVGWLSWMDRRLDRPRRSIHLDDRRSMRSFGSTGLHRLERVHPKTGASNKAMLKLNVWKELNVNTQTSINEIPVVGRLPARPLHCLLQSFRSASRSRWSPGSMFGMPKRWPWLWSIFDIEVPNASSAFWTKQLWGLKREMVKREKERKV